MSNDTAQAIARQIPPSIRGVVEDLLISALGLGRRQLRVRSKDVLMRTAASIQQFGFIVPVVIDESDKIIIGKGRVEAARLIGMTKVPCVRVSHLSDAEKRVFAIAENQLGQLAGWDAETLRIELAELSEMDLSFSLELTGFSAAKIDSIIFGGDSSNRQDNAIPALPDQVVSRVGDRWVLGDHVLLCADATKAESFERLLQGEQARVVFTDPPYNVQVAGHVTSGGLHGEFVMASGEMSDDEFTGFSTDVMARAKENLIDGGLIYYCMDHRHVEHTLAAARATGLERLNIIVWDKKAGGMGSFYRSRHELIFLFRKPGASHLNRVELGKHGRDRSNVWAYEGVNGFGAAKAKAREMHPTVKPLGLVRDAILDSTAKGDAVLDLFSGSGTTIIAAESVKRRGFATELDPRYVDVGVMRWQEFTGREAVLSSTGQTFRQVRAERASAAPSGAATSDTDTAEVTQLTPARVRTRARLAA